MESLYALAATVALKLLGWWLDKVKADTAMKEQFLKFVEALRIQGMVSVKLHQSYEDQLAELKKRNP